MSCVVFLRPGIYVVHIAAEMAPVAKVYVMPLKDVDLNVVELFVIRCYSTRHGIGRPLSHLGRGIFHFFRGLEMMKL